MAVSSSKFSEVLSALHRWKYYIKDSALSKLIFSTRNIIFSVVVDCPV
jgi:hypothetical protein